MSQKITKEFIVKVIGDGLKEVSAELRALHNTTGKTAKETTKLQASNKNLNSVLQGVAGNSANTTKEFAKMQRGISGLVGVYAPLAANVFAVSAAFGALQRAADFDILTQSVREFGIQTGTSLTKTSQDVKTLLKDLVSIKDTMKQVTIATAAGFDTSTIKELAVVARQASQALGRDMADSLERVFRGAIKAEPELLDELGIILRLEPAIKKYASELGKTASQLTTFEKQQAVVNEVLQQGNDKFGLVSDSIPVNSYAQLSATFDEVSKSGLNLLNTVLIPIASFFGSNTLALGAVISLFTVSILKKAIPAMGDFGSTMKNKIDASLIKSAAATKRYSDSVGKMKDSITSFKELHERQFREINKGFSSYLQKAERAGKKGGITRKLLNAKGIKKDTKEYYDKLIKSLSASVGRLEKGLPVVGFKLSDVSGLKQLTADAKIARATIVAGNRVIERSNISTFNRIQLVAEGAWGGATSAFTKFVAISTSTLLSSASTAYSGTWKDVRKSISEATVSQTKYNIATKKSIVGMRIFSSVSSKSLRAVELGFKKVTTSAGLLVGGIARFIPGLAQLAIGVQIFLSTFSGITDMLGITTKEGAAFDDTISSISDTMLSVSKSTAFYNENLKVLNPTVSTQNALLKNQIGRLNDLKSALDDLGKSVAGNSDLLTGSFTELLDVAGFGNISNFRDSLTSITNQLRGQGGLTSELDKLAAKFGDISSLDVTGLKEYRSALSRLSVNTLKAKNESKGLNDSLFESFKKMGELFSQVAGGLPKLTAFEKAALSASKALNKLDGRSAIESIELFSTLKPVELTALRIDPNNIKESTALAENIKAITKDITKLTKAQNNVKRSALDSFLNTPYPKDNTEVIDNLHKSLTALQDRLKLLNTDRIQSVKNVQKEFSSIASEQARLKKVLDLNLRVTNRSNTTQKEKVILLKQQLELNKSLSSISVNQLKNELTSLEKANKKGSNDERLVRVKKALTLEENAALKEQLAIQDKIDEIEIFRLDKKTQSINKTIRQNELETLVIASQASGLSKYEQQIAKQKLLLDITKQRVTEDNKSSDSLDRYIDSLDRAFVASQTLTRTRRVGEIRTKLESASDTTQTPLQKDISKLTTEKNNELKVLREHLQSVRSLNIDEAERLSGELIAVQSKFDNEIFALKLQATEKQMSAIRKKLHDFRLQGRTEEESQTIKTSFDFSSDISILNKAFETAQTIEETDKLHSMLLEREELFQARISEIQERAAKKRLDSTISSFQQIGQTIISSLNFINQRNIESTNEQYAKQAKTVRDGLEKETIALRASVNDGSITRKAATDKDTKNQVIANKKLATIERAREAEQNQANKREFERNKQLSIGLAIINTAVGATKAYQTSGGGFAGIAAATAVTLAGALQVAIIKNQKFNAGSAVASTTPVSGIPSSSTTGSTGTSSQPKGVAGITNIKVLGNKGIVYSQDTMAELLDNIEDAVTRGDRILISRNSRNGQDLISEARINA